MVRYFSSLIAPKDGFPPTTSLTYTGRMVIIETACFEKRRPDYLTEDQYALLGWYLARRPDAGSVRSRHIVQTP